MTLDDFISELLDDHESVAVDAIRKMADHRPRLRATKTGHWLFPSRYWSRSLDWLNPTHRMCP